MDCAETNNKRGGDQTTWIEGLPDAISLDILSRLPITSLQQCKSVSRIWNSSTKDPMLADMHLSHAADHSICIILYSNYPESKIDIVHIEGPDCYTKRPKELTIPFQPLLPYFDIFSSCNGLICLSNLLDGDPIYIYNPTGRAFRELPRVPTRSDLSVFRVVFGFGFHPGTKAYKAIVMVYYTRADNFYQGVCREPEGYVLTLGTSAWRHLGKVHYRLVGPTSEALVNGRLHWLTRSSQLEFPKIISFDIASEEFQEVPQPSLGGLNRSDYHIVELGGCLSVVVPNRDKTNDIWVMKDYNVKESWIKEFVIAHYEMIKELSCIPPARPRRSGTNKRVFRVLCTLKNGEMLISYNCISLVSYNPKTKEFKDLEFEDLPVLFEPTVHLGSLISVDAAFNGMPREQN